MGSRSVGADRTARASTFSPWLAVVYFSLRLLQTLPSPRRSSPGLQASPPAPPAGPSLGPCGPCTQASRPPAEARPLRSPGTGETRAPGGRHGGGGGVPHEDGWRPRSPPVPVGVSEQVLVTGHLPPRDLPPLCLPLGCAQDSQGLGAPPRITGHNSSRLHSRQVVCEGSSGGTRRPGLRLSWQLAHTRPPWGSPRPQGGMLSQERRALPPYTPRQPAKVSRAPFWAQGERKG